MTESLSLSLEVLKILVLFWVFTVVYVQNAAECHQIKLNTLHVGRLASKWNSLKVSVGTCTGKKIPAKNR